MLAIYLTLIDNEDDKKSFEDLYNQMVLSISLDTFYSNKNYAARKI